jgi:hypothetical protein
MEKQLFATPDASKYYDTNVEGDSSLGTLRWIEGKLYRWVKWVVGDALTAGMVVCHTAANGEDMYKTVEKPATANLMLLAGIVPIAVAAGNVTPRYFWLECLGYAETIQIEPITDVTPAAGSFFIPQDGKYTLKAVTTPALAYHRHIQSLESCAAAATTLTASKKGLVSCF